MFLYKGSKINLAIFERPPDMSLVSLEYHPSKVLKSQISTPDVNQTLAKFEENLIQISKKYHKIFIIYINNDLIHFQTPNSSSPYSLKCFYQ